MVLAHRISTVYTVILLSLLQGSLEAKKSEGAICPIGFKVAYFRDSVNGLCYRLKGPENFTDTFKDCSGNLYTTKLYDKVNISNYTEQVIWTEYKTAYPGGPFIDTSFTSSIGSLLESSFALINVTQTEFEEELCVVKEPTGNYTAVRCNEQYYRYCFVEMLTDNVSKEGCEDLKGSRRFWSPKPVCLVAVSGVGGGVVRATWTQSKILCEQRGGEILLSGWRYSDYPELHIYESHVFPLRITYDPSHNTAVRNGVDFMRQPTFMDAHNVTNEIAYGALNNSMWAMVNNAYVFYNVICEKDIEIEEILLSIKVDEYNKLILTVNYEVGKEYIYCFTDSKTYYPTRVEITQISPQAYVLKPENDGNYWCVSNDVKRFKASVSEKQLWIREQQSLENTYAVKLYFGRPYTFHNIKEVSEIWVKKLRDYIYYSTEFDKMSLDYIEDSKIYQNTLKNFKETHPELSPKGDIIYNMRIKKLYLNRTTALVHFEMNPLMQRVRSGWWNNLRVLYMKPVYFCTVDGQKFVGSLKKGCVVHKCSGDFISGVQAVTVIDEKCDNFNERVMQTTSIVTVSMPSVTIIENATNATTQSNVTMNMPTLSTVLDNIFTGDEINEDSNSSEETTSTSTTALTPKSVETTTTNITTETITKNTTTDTTIEITTLAQTTTSIKLKPTTTTSTTEPTTLDTVITAIPSIPTEYTTLPTTTEDIMDLPPEEQLQQVIEDLENLVSNTTTMLPVDTIDKPFDNVDRLLSENVSLEIPSQLLHLLDQLGARLDLNGTEEAQTVRNNVALLVASARSGMPVNGLRIAARESNNFIEGDFEIIRDEVNSSILATDASEAVVHLPKSVANSNQRISFVVFRNDRAFQTNGSTMVVNSRVLSINVPNVTHFEQHESIDIHFNPLMGATGRNQTRTCAYWHFDKDGSGYWSQEGCRYIPAFKSNMLSTCRCTHLTHFAEILISRELFSDLDEKVLEYISVIGCCFSLFGIIMIGITASLFRSWRRDFNNKIWLQLCISIMLLVICFLIVVFAKFNTYNIPCILTGIALHYSVLASFCWMLVAAILSYRRLVLVFTRDVSHKLLKAATFAWGAPFAIIGILLSVNPSAYQRHFEYKSPTAAFCYPSGLSMWLAIYTPIAAMLLANWTLFILIVRSVFASRGIQRHGDTNEALRCASVSCLLVFMFGLPWIFGIFAYNVVAAYFFALTATFQGLVLFVFFVVGNKKTRDLWLNKLKIKQTRKVPVTSSTYTNRSTGGVGWRGGVLGTVEAKASKPRSLASPDDSRFS